MWTRRQFLWVAGAPLLAQSQARPNVVLLVADDLGYGDLSSYGAPDIQTPNIDSLGRDGVRFTQFYANAPECTPTRTALLTGRYQQRVGGLECAIGVDDVGRYDEAEWLANRGELGLPTSEATMAALFKKAGYRTGMFGKWHLGYRDKFRPERHGFDAAFGILGGNADYFTHREDNGREVLFKNGSMIRREGYLTDLFVEEAVAWLRQPGLRRNTPFFLYVPFTAPHTPIQDPDGFDPATGTAPRRQGDRSLYAKMVERMDRRIGAILGEIEQQGAAENTIVIFISDNGADANGRNAPFRGRKSALWEGGIRVPCLIRWPAKLPRGAVCEQVMLTMDLAPTLLAACGIGPPRRGFDGENLLAEVSGAAPRPRRVFWRYKRGENRRKALRDGDVKYINDNGDEFLYDLARDPGEERNLLQADAARAEPYRKQVEAWEREVAAPRLRRFPRG
ncbi:MAG: sulfatase-like hydrolase/transferase [Bryobacterales bacterium]|nr:sulfatase-like hydrolase/transferase [Bryobacterales bacterium]